MARQCLVVVVSWKDKQDEQKQTIIEGIIIAITGAPRRNRAGFSEELIKVKILPDTDRYFKIGASMGSQDKVETLLLVIQNVDVFEWTPYEVPRVDPEFIVHKLNVDPSFPPKKQKPRRSAREHVEVVKSEFHRLKEAGAIKEIHFPEWLANIIVVKKKNSKWRVCVDFMDLNQVCPKDPFRMPKIDQLVDSTYGHPRMGFLDVFQRYHQIARGPRKDRVHFPRCQLSLYCDALWIKKC